jgi:spermidine synthase
VHEIDSHRGRIYVVDEGPLRHLRFGRADATDQTLIDRGDRRRIPMPYLRAAAFATVLLNAPRRALIIGLGGGGFVHALRARFPALPIDAVEIDPAVVLAACSYFGLGEDGRLHIHVADGLAFLNGLEASEATTEYDVILLDAYDGPEIPLHLTTRAFYRRIARRLSKDGIALANVSASAAATERAIARRFSRAFGERCIELQEPRNDNLLLVGACRPLPDRSQMQCLARALGPTALPFPPALIARTARHCRVR